MKWFYLSIFYRIYNYLLRNREKRANDNRSNDQIAYASLGIMCFIWIFSLARILTSMYGIHRGMEMKTIQLVILAIVFVVLFFLHNYLVFANPGLAKIEDKFKNETRKHRVISSIVTIGFVIAGFVFIFYPALIRLLSNLSS